MNDINATNQIDYLKNNIEIIYCDMINMMIHEKKWIDKILEKNMYTAIGHSGSTPACWASGELNRFFSSSFETRMGNVLGEYAENLIKYFYPDAKTKAGNRKKPIDLDALYLRRNIQIHLQVKSSDKWGNSSQKEALAKRMYDYSMVLKNFDHRLIQNVWGYTGGRSYTKTEKCRTVATTILVKSHEDFWDFITEIPNFCSEIITPAISTIRNKMSNSLETAKQSAILRLQSLAEKHVLFNGSIDFPKLYKLSVKNLHLDYVDSTYR